MRTFDFTDDLNGAAATLTTGGLIAVPTETVYGLAANALDESAVEKLFAVKGRPENKPISLMVSGAEEIDRLCENVPKAARTLAETFWPGPLTIVMQAREGIPSPVRAGGETIGLRCPESEKTLELLKMLPFPLAVPSANPSGEASPVDITQVLKYFNGKIEGVINGGECTLGRASTVVDITQKPYKILRQGAATEEDIRMALTADLSLIGITGGTGSGKTTALSVLRNMGALVLDADEIYHELLRGSEPMRREIKARFPSLPDNGIDTKELGKLVFNDPKALSDLGAITHRFVGEEIMLRLSDWAMNGGEVAAIDAIALIEAGLGSLCKATVAITAPTEERISRLMQREGITREYALLRINAQKPDEFFKQSCDYTIENSSTPEEFAVKCKAIFSDIIENK